MGRWGSSGKVLVEGRPEPQPGDETWGYLRAVTSGYLDTEQIPVLRGRGLRPSDNANGLPVALVNEAFIRENFPGQDPLGERFRVTVDFGFGSPTWTVVGVVPDISATSLTGGHPPEVYVPHAQMGQRRMTVAMRLRPGEAFPMEAVREILAGMDQGVPLRHVETMREVMSDQTAATRFYLVLLAIFSGLATLLASVGLYGVIAYLVSRQRHEFGIRMALGARRIGVIRMVLAQSAVPILVGLGAGLIGAALGARVLEGFLYQVNPRDPVVYGVVTLLLLCVGFSSALIPARQASRVDPGDALREE
jgi:putative ABC transport system permease protein